MIAFLKPAAEISRFALLTGLASFCFSSGLAAQPDETDPFGLEETDEGVFPMTPSELTDPMSVDEMQLEAARKASQLNPDRTDTGSTADTGFGEVGQRLKLSDAPTGNPMGRIRNRIENRIENRLDTRIDQNGNRTAATTSAFDEADRRSREARRAGPR